MTTKEKKEKKFTSQAIGEKKSSPKKPSNKRFRISENTIATEKKERIDKELKEIYKDSNGNIPDMKSIQKKKKHPVVKAFFSILFIGCLMSIIAWVGFYYLPQQQEIGKNNIIFEIKGPTELKIGATSTYILSWKNNENTTLNDVVISTNYPEGFLFLESSIEPINNGKNEWHLGKIMPKEAGSLKITGQIFGDLNQEKSWRVFLNYIPENFQSELQQTTTLVTKIIRSPFSLNISGPEKAISNEEVEFLINIKNDEEYFKEKLTITLDLPKSFNLTKSEPKIEKNNSWIIDYQNISTSSESVDLSDLNFKIKGRFNNLTTEEIENYKIIATTDLITERENKIFSITKIEKDIEVIQSNVALILAVNSHLNNFQTKPEEVLNATINLKNNSKESIKNAKIKIVFEAPSINRRSGLNWAKIDDIFDGDIVGEQLTNEIRRGTIVWTSKHNKKLAELKPGEEVGIDFSLPIHSLSSFNFSSLKENEIKIINESSFTNSQGKEETILGKQILATLNSDLDLEVRSSKEIEEEKNIYNTSWILTQNYHSVKDIELSATLFGDSTFTIPENIPAGELNFDENNKKIIWKIPVMPESIDIFALPFKVILNTVDPTQNTLISKVKVKATDEVTGEKIELTGREVLID